MKTHSITSAHVAQVQGTSLLQLEPLMDVSQLGGNSWPDYLAILN
jgi:hypothetical protein